jgi:hypothetical protein
VSISFEGVFSRWRNRLLSRRRVAISTRRRGGADEAITSHNCNVYRPNRFRTNTRFGSFNEPASAKTTYESIILGAGNDLIELGLVASP